MIATGDLTSELAELGKAIGLFKPDDSLDVSWFGEPLTRLESILTNSDQRAGLLDLIDAFFPPATNIPDLAAGEKWHPILGAQPLGNLYFTEVPGEGGIVFGLAGEIHAGGTVPRATLRASIPIFEAANSVSIQFGTQKYPISAILTVQLKDLISSPHLTLNAVRVTAIATVTPPSESLKITLEGLSIDGAAPQDVPLDAANLKAEATHTILALIEAAIAELGAVTGEAAAISKFLLPLLGLSGSVPPFPILTLAEDPQALQKWFASLTQGATPALGVWLETLAGLLGIDGAVVNTQGVPPTRWQIPLFAIGSAANSNLSLTAQLVSGADATGLEIGLLASILPSDATPPLRVEAQAVLMTIPLAGSMSAVVLPSASLTLIAPGDPAKNLSSATVTVQSMRAGFTWANSKFQPVLELDTVTFGGTTYPHIDLTNAESVESALSSLVATALGNGAGKHLAALAGLVEPEGAAPGWKSVDAGAFLASPPRAIGQYHRDALANGQWVPLFTELAELFGLTVPPQPAGAGTPAMPWNAPLESAAGDALTLELVAWNAQSSGVAGDPQQLRIGIRAIAARAPGAIQWISELLAFDLAKTGSGNVTFFAGQHVIFTLAPIPAVPQIANFSISAAGFEASLDWSPATGMQWNAGISNLSIFTGPASVTIPSLQFPPAAGLDFSNPSAAAAGLGISLDNFELLVRLMIARAAFSWGGVAGLSISGLLGIHSGLSGLPADWPTLEDPTTPGSLFANPLPAVRAWLVKVALGVSANGFPFLMPGLAWLNALAGDALPDSSFETPPTFDLPFTGSGTYDDPWALPMIAGNPPAAELLVWLDSAAGMTAPPAAWAAALVANAGSITDFPSLIRVTKALAPFYPSLASATQGLDSSALSDALTALGSYLNGCDGVVTPASAIPSGGQWQAAATPTTFAHHLLPGDPAAITQILAQIDAWAGGPTGTRAVLLLSPNFGSPDDWKDLLASPDRHGTADPGATFNLAVPGADPTTLDLSGVTLAVDYYTATLQDDGSGNVTSLQNQIDHVIARINAIRGNVPVTLVAHSTAGIPARAYTAANPAKVQGLITLGTPHGGSPLTFLTDPNLGNALRLVQRLLPAMLPDDPITSALTHLLRALDGYTSPTAGSLPVPVMYPAGDFNFTSGNPADTGGKPALALGGTLTGNLLALTSFWAAALGTSAANPAVPPPAPTHLGFGMRVHAGLPAPALGGVAIDSSLRFDACRVKLSSPAEEPARPAQGIRIRTKISRPGGWLVGASSSFGGAGSAPLDVRVRWAEVGVDFSPSTSGVVSMPQVLLHDASYHGPVTSLVSFLDAQAQPLLGAVLQTVSATPPAAGSGLAQWLAWMQALKIVVADPHGGLGISADAWNAIAANASTFLLDQLASALNSGTFAGFTGTNPWVSPVPGMPFEIYVSNTPGTIGLRTTAAGLSLAANALVSFDGHLAFSPASAALDATLNVGAFALKWSTANSQLTAQAPPWLAPVQLFPFDAGKFAAALKEALPRLLFSATASAIFESIIGTSLSIGPLDTFFSAPAAAINDPGGSLGAAGGGLDPAKLTALLQAINSAVGSGSGDAWVLPAGLQLSVTGNNTPAQPTTLQLKTTTKIGGILDLALDAAFDRNLHVTPGGTISLNADLGAGVAWSPIAIDFGISPAGVTLSVKPNTVAAVQLLPTVSGLSNLAAGATALLPGILDSLLPPNPATGSALLQAVLDVARAFQLYDDGGHFSTHTPQFQALLETNWTSAAALTSTAQQAIATAVKNLFAGAAGAFPLTVTSSGATVSWEFALPSPNAGTLTLSAGWDSSGPTVMVNLQGVRIASGAIAGALTGNAAVAISPSSTTDPVKLAISLALDLSSALPINVTPELSVTYGSSGLQVQLLPLAQSGSNGPLVITIAPVPGITTTPTLVNDLAHELLLPLAGNLVVEATSALQATPLWPGGPSATAVLSGAGLIDGAGKFVHPLPDLGTVIGKVTAQLLSGLNLTVPGGLKLTAAVSGNLVGIALSGSVQVPLDSLTLEVKFGAPVEWKSSMTNGAATDTGLVIYLVDTSGPISFHPRIDLIGVGVGLGGADGAPLVKTDEFRLNGADLYLFLSWDLLASATPGGFGAGMELDQLGLPLGAITSGNAGGNPVASSLLTSNPGSAGGDPHPVNPGVDVSAWYWSASTGSVVGGDDKLHVLFGGIDGPLWIPVQAGFGPIYIDQLGIEPKPDPGVAILIDGSVKVDGLTAQADELGVTIPYNHLTTPGDWSLDLAGLGVGFRSPGVTMAGALLKNTLADGTIEYDGMLLLQISEFGFIAVGAYSTPKSADGDRYTSLFVFLGAFIVIGLPPIIEIDGLGLGIGYNRELVPPTDLNQIPGFILVEALDDAGAIANDPMGELKKIGNSIPAKRGSFWLAAGLHGTSFAIVHVTAILYVALDRGVEIGVLGVARMALPSDDTALACLELALKARFSTAEGILSIQAQLTDNSYLIDRDCQLTGGFAYFMWFPQSQFVLSVGGYNPHFSKPVQFPDVPRVGYHWSLLGALSVRGECYFALTNSCVMAGTLFDVSYGPDWLQLWFKAYGDFLASWDPFYFEADVGVSVGATFAIQVDLWFTTISVDITVSIGATLVVKGPPLHGTIKVDLEIASVTVAFGTDHDPSQDLITDWNVFVTKYVYGGDPNGFGVAAHATAGILPPMPAGAQPSPGTQASPWQMGTEFSFKTESRMPAGAITDIFNVNVPILTPLNEIDVAPMGLAALSSTHTLKLEVEKSPNNWIDATTTSNVNKPCFTFTPVVGQLSEATWHTLSDPTHVPAAANTISAIVGVSVVATAIAKNPTGMIPIGTLSDDHSPRPLPFAQPLDLTHLKALGALADTLSAFTGPRKSSAMLAAASKLLSGGGFFATARQSSGLPAAGLSPVGVRSLLYSRSSPPRLAPITTGLTMKAVGLAAPSVIQKIPPVTAISLQQPRLRAVLQANAAPASDAPPPQRTTVSNAPKTMRSAAPVAVNVAGARLVRIKAASAPRRTSIAAIGREFRHTDFGHVANVAQLKAQDQATIDLVETGCTLPAGVTHLWDVPDAGNQKLIVSGDAARVTCLDRAGAVLSDREFSGASGVTITLPANCAMVAVSCLGRTSVTPSAGSPSGMGALSLHAGVDHHKPVVGWQTGNLVPQIGATTLLGRGCCMVLAQHNPVRRVKQQTSQAMVRIGPAMLDKTAVETLLPAAIDVVMVLLDQQAPCAESGDLQIAATGVTLATQPVRVEGGARKALLYAVEGRDAKAPYATVAVASFAGWRIAGVIGLAGNAQEWAVSMNGGIPAQLVPNGPFTADGRIVVQLKSAGGNS